MRIDLLKDLYREDWELPRSLEALDIPFPRGTRETIQEIFQCGADGAPAAETPYTDRLAAASSKGRCASSGQVLPVNTYPFGTPTKDVYTEFVGVCVGGVKLPSVLDKAKKHCEAMERRYPADVEKTAVILTDKWDYSQFREKYEHTFLRYALEQNVFFVFLLVTDYGVTQIPFLAKYRSNLDELRTHRYIIENDNPQEALDRLIDFGFCKLESSGGTWARYDHKSYEFDFRSCECYIESVMGDPQKKKIPMKAIRTFAMEVMPLYDLPKCSYSDNRTVMDAGSCQASIFGKEFFWYNIGPDEPMEPCLKIVSAAFNRLILALKD